MDRSKINFLSGMHISNHNNGWIRKNRRKRNGKHCGMGQNLQGNPCFKFYFETCCSWLRTTVQHQFCGLPEEPKSNFYADGLIFLDPTAVVCKPDAHPNGTGLCMFDTGACTGSDMSFSADCRQSQKCCNRCKRATFTCKSGNSDLLLR